MPEMITSQKGWLGRNHKKKNREICFSVGQNIGSVRWTELTQR